MNRREFLGKLSVVPFYSGSLYLLNMACSRLNTEKPNIVVMAQHRLRHRILIELRKKAFNLRTRMQRQRPVLPQDILY